jgi:hypothetical protein
MKHNYQQPMLLDYQNMSTDSLMELLAHETVKLTELLAEKKFDAEYEKCKEGIKQIHVILDIRKGTTTTPNPIFREPTIRSIPEIQNDTNNTGETL